MIDRRSFLAVAVLVAARGAFAQGALPVVTSFTILADLAKNVAGDRAMVTSLVGPGGDAHLFQPSPADARRVADARLVIVNGMGFEGWMARLAKASGAAPPAVTASRGVAPRKGDDGHDVDPHAWQSVANTKIYVANIRDALIAADAAGAGDYRARADAYLAELDRLDSDIRAAVAAIPPARRKVITTHDAFGYFADAYGLAFLAPRGVATESEASAKDVARIIRQIRAEKIPAVFLENIADPRLMQRIAQETGAAIGGTLYSDSLSPPDGPAGTYIAMMRHNIRELTKALA